MNIRLNKEECQRAGYLESHPSITPYTLILDTTENSSETVGLDLENVCVKWASKVFNLLEIFTVNKFNNCIEVRQVKMEGVDLDGKTNSYIAYAIRIKNTRDNSFLFDTFKRLGINISILEAIVEADFKFVYLSQNVFKMLGKYSEDAKAQLMLYLVNVFQFCILHGERDVKLSYDRLTRTFKVYDKAELELIKTKAFYQWNNKDGILVENLSDLNDFKSVITGSSGPGTVEPNYRPRSLVTFKNVPSEICYGHLKNEIYDGSVIIIKQKSLLPYPTVSVILTKFVKNNLLNNVFTNMDLDFETIFSDQFSNLMSLRTGGHLCVYTGLDFDVFFKNAEFTPVDNLEELDFEESPSELDFYIRAIPESLEVTECEDLEFLKQKGVIIKASSAFTDVEAIKESYKDDEYAQKLYSQILPYFENFELRELNSIVRGFAKENGLYTMLFTGPSGTGKSTAARVIPTRCGLPFISVNFSLNIEESDFIGAMVPNINKKDESEPEFVWKDGILTTAVRNGYVLILEEFNFARPGVLGKLNSLLDDARQLDLPTGEVIKAHKNFRMIFTCNVGYEGTNRLNKALVNRMDFVHNFKDLSRDEMIKIIKKRTGYTKQSNIDAIVTVYAIIKKFIEDQRLDAVISIRQLLAIFKVGMYFKNAEDAVKDVFLSNVFLEEPEYIPVVLDAIRKAITLTFKI